MVTDTIYRALRRTRYIQRQFKRVVVRLSAPRQVVHFGQRCGSIPPSFTVFKSTMSGNTTTTFSAFGRSAGRFRKGPWTSAPTLVCTRVPWPLE